VEEDRKWTRTGSKFSRLIHEEETFVKRSYLKKNTGIEKANKEKNFVPFYCLHLSRLISCAVNTFSFPSTCFSLIKYIFLLVPPHTSFILLAF